MCKKLTVYYIVGDLYMMYFKYNVQDALKNKGYTTYILQRDKLLSSGIITKIRNNDAIKLSLSTIDKICELLDCQPGDILEYIPEEKACTEPEKTGEKAGI